MWPWTRRFISLGLSFSIFIALTFYNFLIPLLRKEKYLVKIKAWGFPGGAVVENLPANAGDMGSSPGLGRSHMPWSN